MRSTAGGRWIARAPMAPSSHRSGTPYGGSKAPVCNNKNSRDSRDTCALSRGHTVAHEAKNGHAWKRAI